MTKNKANAVFRELDVKCDQPFMFAVKVDTGCLCAVKNHDDGWALLTLFLTLLERTMHNLKKQRQDEFRAALIRALQDYLNDDKPIEPQEVEHDKEM